MCLFKSTSIVVLAILLSASPIWSSPLAGEVAGGRACAISSARSITLPASVALPNAYTGNTPDPVTTAMKAWTNYFMRLSSNARVSDRARAALKAEMMNVASTNRLVWPKGWDQGEHRPSSVIYHTMETVFPYAVAYAQFRDEFTAPERKVIDVWLGEIIDRIGRTKKIKFWKLDNKKYQYGALAAAFGHATGQRKYLSIAAKIYKTAIRGLRKDGSFPGDSGRGGNALHYSNLALANLVAIAEFSAASGVDLYKVSTGGRSLHDAVTFLAAATADPSLITGYAAQQTGSSFAGYSPSNPDRRWAGSAASSWGYYYLRRFGNTASGQRLKSVSPFLRAGKSGVHQQSGGNARCFAG